MKRAASWIVAAVLLLAGTSVYAADMKIGYVDLIRALNESDSGKRAKADLEFLIKSKQVVIDEKGKAIEKGKADLEKQASVLSSDARKTKEEELERLIRDYQRLVTDSQGEVKKRETELTGDIVKELRALVQKMGKDDGYMLIFENAEGQILYAVKEGDLTDTVIAKYNETKKSKK